MAGIAVNLYAQATKIACFTEGAAIYSCIWHIIIIQVIKTQGVAAIDVHFKAFRDS